MNIKKIISDKYKTEAELLDESMVHVVRFKDGEKEMKIGLPISYYDEELEELARKSVDSYFDLKTDGEREGKTPMLHGWYISTYQAEEKEFLIAHGIVTGHKKLSDSTYIHTSAVKDFYVDDAAGNMVIHTRNTTYRCPLGYWSFRKQEKYKDLIPDYDFLKEKYENARPRPEIEPGNVLLVLADFCEYYFHSLYYRKDENEVPYGYSGWPHIGTFQDSFLIEAAQNEEEVPEIDLRYFPHFQNIEFYSEDTNGRPLYIENVGGGKLYARTSAGTIELDSGERKQVKKENAMKEEVFLAGGDLYPAGFIDGEESF